MDDQVKASHFSHQNRLQKARRHLHRLLSPSAEKGNASWWLDIFLMSLISLNILAVILETVKPLALQHRIFFYWFEFVSVLVFSVEYLLRLWAANEEPAYRTPVLGNLRYALTPLALVDLLAILPFYLPLVGLDLRFLRILRLLRLFTLFKLARYSAALTLFAKVFREKREELLISITFTLFLLLVSSSLMYYVENQAQPEVFSSIPETMWWGIATLTTVGYGDVYPITGLGKFLAGVIALLGIGLFALPTSILASGFSTTMAERKTEKARCPHCGGEL